MVFWFMIVDLYEFLFQECKNVFFDTDTEQFLSFVTFAGVQQTSAIFFTLSLQCTLSLES